MYQLIKKSRSGYLKRIVIYTGVFGTLVSVAVGCQHTAAVVTLPPSSLAVTAVRPRHTPSVVTPLLPILAAHVIYEDTS